MVKQHLVQIERINGHTEHQSQILAAMRSGLLIFRRSGVDFSVLRYKSVNVSRENDQSTPRSQSQSSWRWAVTSRNDQSHKVEYDPFIKSQLASCNWLKGLVWRKFGHVSLKKWGNETLELHRVATSLRQRKWEDSRCPLLDHGRWLGGPLRTVHLSRHKWPVSVRQLAKKISRRQLSCGNNQSTRLDLTECVYQLVLESQLPHKIINSSFTIPN